MATNDGYAPYPIGLTAAQTVEAILRAFNLDTEFANYVKYTGNATAPVIAVTKDGDIWVNSTAAKVYRAYIADSTLFWFEV